MPWRQEPMKDVVDCEKLRGAVSERRSGDIRMGEPTQGNAWGAHAEHIGMRRARGELKHLSTLRKRENSPSSGERKGRSPNLVRGSVQALRAGGCKRSGGPLHRARGVTKRGSRGRALGRPTGEGESPVRERSPAPAERLSTTGHANPVGSRGDQPPRLNTLSDR